MTAIKTRLALWERGDIGKLVLRGVEQHRAMLQKKTDKPKERMLRCSETS